MIDLSKVQCLNADFPPAPTCCECGGPLPPRVPLTGTNGDTVLRFCDACAEKVLATL